MATSGGEDDGPRGPLELNETLTIETSDGTWLPFEVVGILEDSEDGVSYAVLRREPSDAAEDEFIVTDAEGNLVQDEELAQGVLDDFLALAEEGEDRAAHNGETK